MGLQHCSDPWPCRHSYYALPGLPEATCTLQSICTKKDTTVRFESNGPKAQ